MGKVKKYIGWSSLIICMSCSNMSNLCRHPDTGASFRFEKKDEVGEADIPGLFFENEFTLSPGVAPVKLTWVMLKEVGFQSRYNKDFRTYIQYPVFTENLKKLNGKEACISGYMIPLDVKNGLYALSKVNYASCFFCGRSGPESVVSLKFANPPRRYKTDEYLTMKGVLELNDTNINDFIYIFRKTEEYKL